MSIWLWSSRFLRKFRSQKEVSQVATASFQGIQHKCLEGVMSRFAERSSRTNKHCFTKIKTQRCARRESSFENNAQEKGLLFIYFSVSSNPEPFGKLWGQSKLIRTDNKLLARNQSAEADGICCKCMQMLPDIESTVVQWLRILLLKGILQVSSIRHPEATNGTQWTKKTMNAKGVQTTR